MMELKKAHINIMRHAQKNGMFCGDGDEMTELCDEGMMEFLGRKSFVPEGYYKITSKGQEALRTEA